MRLWQEIPADWQQVLPAIPAETWWLRLEAFVDRAYQTQCIYPPRTDLFRALHTTPFTQVRVVILGQDPYPGEGQAHGLSFSVKPGVALPRSLQNIFKELESDLEIRPAHTGCLESWARQGVLLLNTVLTVQAGASHSHRNQGWEQFTDQILIALDQRPDPIAFVLWGKPARQKKKLLKAPQHLILESAHPSPLSAHQGFFGSRPFSKLNAWLHQQNKPPIDWQIP